jgi:hypothetical protein
VSHNLKFGLSKLIKKDFCIADIKKKLFQFNKCIIQFPLTVLVVCNPPPDVFIVCHSCFNVVSLNVKTCPFVGLFVHNKFNFIVLSSFNI